MTSYGKLAQISTVYLISNGTRKTRKGKRKGVEKLTSSTVGAYPPPLRRL